MSPEDQSSDVKSSDRSRSEAATLPSELVNGDRRRPGRIERPYPAMISMLRHPSDVIETSANNDDQQQSDDHRVSRGIVVAVFLSLPIWVLIVVGVSWALR